MRSNNQIAVFFDYPYLWKELIYNFDFLHGDNDRGKVGSEATNFGWI